MSQGLTQSLGYNLSKDPETEGFDLQAGQTWIYPTNYPIRDYQFNIIQKALLKNTLVSLPTGLGKTFIAAVVMYNFFRWYPLGKVIFMAPTRPLVKQQIDACYDIMAIPKDVTVELTGSKMANCREDIWKDKRVFFITPQILQNDLDKLTELGPKIKCLVFDEAHRARGNHAYCQVIRKLIVHNKFFRVLSLSATPGSNISDVSEVVQNLLISHLEFRTEESPDVQPYVYERNLTTVVVPLEKMLQKVKDDYLQILEYYTRTLIKYKVIQGNCGNLTKGKIFLTMKEFQQKPRNNGSSNYAEIMKSLNICVTLYHAFELLVRHGLRSFLSFFDEHIDKPLLRGNTRLIEIMNEIREYLGPEPNIEQLPDGSYPKIPETTKFGHPKFYKLRDILLSHFSEAGESSRVIVFFEYRNSVMEAYALLFQSRPILKPRIFLGQGHGVTQRLQLNVVKSFREGECNVLLSTCIAEEGLDVGDVDLIVCFDISNKSPIRMVQRMGRTGRKKKGSIIVLVTEGKEQQILKDCLIHKNNIAYHVLSSKELAKGLNYCSPRLVPIQIMPKCEKIYITVKKPQLTKNCSLKNMFRNISSSSSEPTFSPDLEIVDIQEKIFNSEPLWNKESPLVEEFVISDIFHKRIEKQRSLQPIHRIKHTESSKILVDLLQLVDCKRFNIPVSQIGSASQLTQNRNLKQSDIRNMFLKSQSSNNVVPNQDKKTTPTRTIQVEENNLFDSEELLEEISHYLSIRMSIVNKKCKHCPSNIDCHMHNISLQNTALNWNQVDNTVFETITTEDLNFFAESLTPNSKKICNEFEFNDLDIFENMDITKLEIISKNNISKSNTSDINSKQLKEHIYDDVNTDISFGEKSVAYQAPKNLDLILSKYSISGIDIPDISEAKDEKKYFSDTNQNCNILNNSVQVNDADKSNDYEVLEFFKCINLAELFYCKNVIDDSQETVIYSPDIFENTILKEKKSVSAEYKNEFSPVLCTFERVRNVKKCQKNIFKESPTIKNTCKEREISVLKPKSPFTRPNLQKLNLYNRIEMSNEVDTPSKFTVNVTPISSTPIGETSTGNRKLINLIESNSNSTLKINSYNMSNVCTKNNTQEKNEQAEELNNFKEKEIKNNFDIDDICDLSIFGLPDTKDSRISLNSEKCLNKSENEENVAKDQIVNIDVSKISSLSSNFDIDEFCDLTTFGMVSQDNKKSGTENEVNQNVIIVNDCKTANTKNINKLSQSQMPITQILSLVNKDEKMSKNEQFTTLQKDNFDLNTSNILDNKLLHNEDCNFSNKRANLFTQKKELLVNKTSPIFSKTPVVTKQVKKKLRSLKKISFSELLTSKNSDDEFEEDQNHYREQRATKSQINNKDKNRKGDDTPSSVRFKKKKNVFIDDEAEISIDENVNISEDEDEDKDMYEISFIEDETQHIDTQMHARYLQSLKSPGNKGRFKIPQRQGFVGNVYSQEVNHEDDTYLDDSFVVHEETDLTQHELSELEILEQKLKDIKKNKRKKSEDITEPAKRRRIIQVLSDDDSD